MEALIISIALLVVAFGFGIRFILPREVWTNVLSEIIHDAIQGIWSLIFGPPRVRVVRKKKRKKLINKKKKEDFKY